MGCFDSENKVGAEGSPDGGKYGNKREFDPNFRGPIKSRSCTDIICCAVFLVFLLGQVVVAYFAFSRGNPALLIYPTDSSGDLCGYAGASAKPNLVYFDITRCVGLGPAALLAGGCPSPSVCMAQCPTANWAFLTLAVEESASGSPSASKRRAQMICLKGVDPGSAINLVKDVPTLVKEKLCAPYTVDSQAVVKRCVPTVIIQAAQFLGSQLETAAGQVLVSSDNHTITDSLLKKGSAIFEARAIAESILADLGASWGYIVCGLVLAMLLSLLYIVLLRIFAGCMVWFTLIGFFLLFLGAAGYCFYRYQFVASQSFSNSTTSFQLYTNVEGWSSYLEYKETWLAIGIAASIFVVILLVIIIFLRNRLRLAIALVGQASKAIGSITTTLIFPIFPFILELGVIGMWAGIALYLASTKQPAYGASNATSTGANITCSGELHQYNTLECNFFKYTGNYWSIVLQVYNLFLALWLLNFVIALGLITLAGAFSSWYWAWRKPRDVPLLPILSSLARALRYHLGSLAFGSFLIALVQLIRIVLEYIDRKVKGRENPCAKFLLCCLKCCFWCLERCVKFIAKNAYIMIAIYGKNFCISAKDAFLILMRNMVRVAVVDKVTGFVLFLGKLILVAANTALAYFFFSAQIPYIALFTPQLKYFFIPVVIIGIGTFFVATLFFSVFESAVDTLFLCVMEDLERHDGTPEKPYFMSRALMSILDVDNKFKDDSKKEGCGMCCC